MSPIALIGAGVLLLLLGAGFGYWIGSFAGRKQLAKSGAIQAEFDDYRRDVTEHFSATAEHFRSIGAEYRKLYDHMATGAGALCRSDLATGIPFSEPVEALASATEQPVEDSRPPRDYEAPVAVEPEIVELMDSEPSDVDLARTEAAEELLAEQEIEVKAEKTLH
jgi:hypothetical protein